MDEQAEEAEGASLGELARRRGVLRAALGIAGLAAAPAALAAKGGKKNGAAKKNGAGKKHGGKDKGSKGKGGSAADAESKHKHKSKPTPAATTLVRATFKDQTTVDDGFATDLSVTCEEGSGIAVGGGYAVTKSDNPQDPSRGENFVTRSQLIGDTNEYRATLVNHSGITLAFEVEVHCLTLE